MRGRYLTGAFLFYFLRGDIMGEFDYASNSDKSRKNGNKDNRVVNRVTKSSPTVVKKSFARRMIDTFIPEDVDDPMTYFVMDVAWPLLKRGLYDIGTGILDEVFGYKGGRRSSGSYYSYDKCSKDRPGTDSRRRNTSDMDYENIRYDDREEAESVLEGMFDCLDRYKQVTVADLYDLAGVQTHNFNLSNYGWINLSGSHPVPVRGGYILKLPRAIPLD